MTGNGEGLHDFKRGPFDIGAPVKLCKIEYKNKTFNPSLNFIEMGDSIFLNMIQISQSLEYTELEGTYYPKDFTNWQDFAKETKRLMCNEFDLEDFKGTYRDKMKYEKDNSPVWYNP